MEIAGNDNAAPVTLPWQVHLKRGLDVALATAGILFFFPILILAALLVRLDTRGPILYKQWRIGKGARRFQIIKFRTMHATPLLDLEQHLAGEPGERLSWEQFQKLWNDPRLTRTGRFLRRYSLDELPQLWNVLWGEMSLVGPRPILPEQLEAYGNGFGIYILQRPGLTGLWQVKGRNLLSFSERARWDVEYYRCWSIRMDFQILWRTVWVVLGGVGAY